MIYLEHNLLTTSPVIEAKSNHEEVNTDSTLLAKGEVITTGLQFVKFCY